MINFILQHSLFYRLYQKIVRKNNHEYDLFKFIFENISKSKKIKMLDLCSGDSFILKYVDNYIDEYIGVDNNEKYLKKLKVSWPNYKFINKDISKLSEIEEIKNFSPNLVFMNGAIHHLDDKIIEAIKSYVSRLENCMFLSVDPIKHNNKFVNNVMLYFDRGKYIRNQNQYKNLMKNFDQFIIDDFYKMSFQNVFHYKNINILGLYNNWKELVN